MSAIDTLRDALFGNPPQPNKEPSREGVLAAFTELLKQVSALSSGVLRYATKALMDADTAQDDGAIAYVYADSTAANNKFWQWDDTGGAWVAADWYFSAVAAAAAVTSIAGNNTYFVGAAGNDTVGGVRNTGGGKEAGFSLTSASDNAFWGYRAGYGATAGGLSVAVGSQALLTGGGGNNVAVGAQALAIAGSASQYNNAVGAEAMYAMDTGDSNNAFGFRALYSNATGMLNVAFGEYAAFSFTGSSIVAIGGQAAFSVTTAQNLVAIGRNAAWSKTTGDDCTYVGMSAGFATPLKTNTGAGNTAFGAYALGHNEAGASNTAVGRAAGWYNRDGVQNAYLGWRCGYGNVDGSDNVAIGYLAGHNSPNADKAVMIGSEADFYFPDSSATTATAVAGSALADGTYTYRFTFVLDGVETGVSEPPVGVAVAGANGAVDLASIPIYSGPRNCTARKIYRTEVDGENVVGLVATINDNTTTTYSDTTADVDLGALPSQADGWIVLGYKARAMKAGQMVVGSPDARITEEIIGGGADDTAPATVTRQASNASGSNVAGASQRIAGGKGTGSGKGGRVILATAPAGSSGSSANAHVDWVELTADGALELKETTSAAVSTPDAGKIALFVEGGALKFKNPAGTVLTISAS